MCDSRVDGDYIFLSFSTSNFLNKFCGILVEAGSEEEAVVRAKLNRNDLKNMLPFHPVTGVLQNSMLASDEDSPIVFTPSGGSKHDKIHAEIEILDCKKFES